MHFNGNSFYSSFEQIKKKLNKKKQIFITTTNTTIDNERIKKNKNIPFIVQNHNYRGKSEWQHYTFFVIQTTCDISLLVEYIKIGEFI